MKNIVLLIAVCCAFSGFSQSFELHQGGEGIWITLSDPLKKDVISIERAEGSKAFEPLVTLRPPASQAELETRMQNIQKILPDARAFDWQASELWIWLNNQEDTHSLLRHPGNQVAVGAAWHDQTVEKGKTYRYRIRGKEKTVQVASPERFSSNWKKVRDSIQHTIPDLTWYSTDGFSTASIKVHRGVKGRDDFEPIQTIWAVFHSENGDTTFIRMQDTSLHVEGQFQYRVQPLDRWGNPGESLSPATYTHLDRAKRPYVTAFVIEGNELHWEVKNPQLLRSIHVYRGRSAKGEFRRVAVLPSNQRSFEDHMDVPMESMFYYLVANDLMGENRRSIVTSMVDTTLRQVFAPAAPSIRQTNQGIEIQWERPHGEVRGYRVVRRKGYRGDWKPASEFLPARGQQEQWIDTSSIFQEGELYSYGVIAESESYTKSPVSEQRTIRIKSDAPLGSLHWIEARLAENKVVLHWEDLFAREPALKGYRIYRQRLGTPGDPILIQENNQRSANRFVDETLRQPGEYAYYVEAFDIFGMTSPLSQEAIINWTGDRASSNLYLNARKVPEGIQIQWRGQKIGQKVELWRSTNNADWVLIHQHDSDTPAFLDRQVRKGNLYQYEMRGGDVAARTLMRF